MEKSSKVIQLTKADLNRVDEFVANRVSCDISLYKKRGGFKEVDIKVGALAEIGVYKLLKSHNLPCSKPDFAIHLKGDKSYGADLVGVKREYHVKGQSIQSAKRYGNSWLMQRYDPLVIKSKPHSYLVPTLVDLATNEVHVFGFFSFNALHHHKEVTFGECEVPAFRKYKIAIYLDSLEVISHKARWGLLWRK